MKKATALLVALIVTGACATGEPKDVGARSRLGDDQAATGAAKSKGKPKKALKKAQKVAKKAGLAGSAAAGSSKAAGEEPSSTRGVSSEIDPSLARASASLDDPADDATKQGVTPAYAELVYASIVGLGENFRMTLRFNGQIPQTMPNDKTHWIVAFGITGRNEGEGYSFGAQCTTEGWQAYAGGKDDSGGEFPGTFVAEGNEIVMTVPWSYIEGPREFKWYAASNWFSQLANTTHYSVDLVPNKDLAKFPN